MIVRAKRFFISSIFGNVDAGRVLDLPDGKARQLIDAGLVGEHKVAPVVEEQKQTSFQDPVRAEASGSLSQAGRALQNKTVSVSEDGEKKVTYRKRKSLQS